MSDSTLNVSAQQEFYTSMFHGVNPGDLIGAMGAMKAYYDATQRKVKVLQNVKTKAQYYPGAIHPTVDENGINICCNDNMFDMLVPLIESQYYIHSMEKYQGQPFDIDLNVIRGRTNVNLPNGPLQGWIPLAFPDLYFDMSKPWIIIEGECPDYIKEQVDGKVIINFTERYRNNMLDYFFLKNYAPDLVFAGTKGEHWAFCNHWQLSIPYLNVNNFLDLAHAIKNARFLFANQSMCLNLSYAMGTPRVFEICTFAQNIIQMVGEHNYGFIWQTGAEYYFRKLYNLTANKKSLQ